MLLTLVCLYIELVTLHNSAGGSLKIDGDNLVVETGPGSEFYFDNGVLRTADTGMYVGIQPG